MFWQEEFAGALLVSLRIAFLSAVLACVFGVLLCFALIQCRQTRGPLFYLIRLPILTPHAVVAVFVVNLLSQTGLFARAAFALGLISDYPQFPQLLYTPSYTGTILAYLWKEIPFVAYFVLALMSSVSSTLGEAAENLGASPVRSFFEITLPLSLPAILKAFLIIFIFAFGGYELPFSAGQHPAQGAAGAGVSELPKPRSAAAPLRDGDERGHPAALLLDGAAVRPADRPAFQADWRWQTGMKRTNHPLLRLVLVLAAAIILVPVAVLLLWSVTGRWPWPNLLPESYTLRTVQELLFRLGQLTGAAVEQHLALRHRRAAEHRHRPAHCPRHRAVLLPGKNPCASGLHPAAAGAGHRLCDGQPDHADLGWDCPTRWPGSCWST